MYLLCHFDLTATVGLCVHSMFLVFANSLIMFDPHLIIIYFGGTVVSLQIFLASQNCTDSDH